MSETIARIRKLAEALADPTSDSDDLIYAFHAVEERRYEVAATLLALLEEHQPEDEPR